MTGDGIQRGAWTVRTFTAPTEAEADALANSTISAFGTAGWRIQERFWIPGDRRPSLAESILLSPESENLLDADGTLRITFANDRADAVAPTAAEPIREPDSFESLGGTRYRRLVPRWILSGVVALIGLLIILSFIGGMPGFSNPTPDPEGICPLGYAPSYVIVGDATTSIRCDRI